MPYHYTDPNRESDPYALPDVEVFTAHREEDGIVVSDGYEIDLESLRD